MKIFTTIAFISLISSFIVLFTTWHIGWFFILFACFCLFSAISLADERSSIKDKSEYIKHKILSKLEAIDYDDILFSLKNDLSLSFSEANQELYITNLDEIKPFSFSDVIESRIEEDGELITKTIRSSQIGGAVVGGILAGTVGAVIGGVSAKRKTDNKIKSLNLIIVVDDTAQPSYSINLMDKKSEYPYSLVKYDDAKRKAEHWHNLISVFIKRSNKQVKNP